MTRILTNFVVNLLAIALVCVSLLAIAVSLILINPRFTQKTIQFAANQATKSYLAKSVQIGSARFDSRGRITIENLSASVQTEKGPVRFSVRKLYSNSCVIDFFRKEGLELEFENLVFDGSKLAGMSGTVRIKGVREWFVDVTAKVNGIGFEEITWINPGQLNGMTGDMLGTIDFHAEKNQEPLLHAELEVKAPGGVMQTQLIRYLFQYLPPVTIKPEVKRMVDEKGLVPYSGARIMTQMETTDRIKVFLFISIPDYNFNLNTNIEIRIDEKNAFGQIAQIFGLIKSGHS